MALLKAEKIKKTYGRVVVFNDLSLAVEQVENLTLLGPSGCGKSTLLRMFAGLEKPDEGVVKLRREPITGPRREIALMFQSPTLLPWKTALDNVALSLVARGMSWREAREAAMRYLAFVGLSGFEEAYPSQLSGGCNRGWLWRGPWRWSPKCCSSTSPSHLWTPSLPRALGLSW
jgi:NitT/TauT family transport system ATP-binding protein